LRRLDYSFESAHLDDLVKEINCLGVRDMFQQERLFFPIVLYKVSGDIVFETANTYSEVKAARQRFSFSF
jgi:hypothetical protein